MSPAPNPIVTELAELRSAAEALFPYLLASTLALLSILAVVVLTHLKRRGHCQQIATPAITNASAATSHTRRRSRLDRARANLGAARPARER